MRLRSAGVSPATKLRNAMVFVLLTELFFFSGIYAGEPAPPIQPVASHEQPDDKKLVDETVFNFDAGERRDPFTFTKIVPSSGDDAKAGVDLLNPNKKQLRPHEVEAKKKQAEELYVDAEHAFMVTEFVSSVTTCDRGLEIFKDITNLLDYPLLQTVRDNLLRLRKASERMKQRQNADREFGRLNIKVTGVVARDKRSQAIINGMLVNKGSLVTTSADSNDTIMVDEILPERVIFLFRGYKMALFLPEIGK
ncbi:MAG: hypothetical protein V1899_07565 [Planctomycetota bacterium]